MRMPSLPNQLISIYADASSTGSPAMQSIADQPFFMFAAGQPGPHLWKLLDAS
jgi:hypothetical protein